MLPRAFFSVSVNSFLIHHSYNGHGGNVVEDCAWHGLHANLFGSVGDDRRIAIWDFRNAPKKGPVHSVLEAHEKEVNCISFSPFNEFLFCTGSADASVALWDIRNLKCR